MADEVKPDGTPVTDAGKPAKGKALTVNAGKLFAENFNLREERRTLRARVAELEGQRPADGSVVLSATDAATWQAFQALQLTPDAIRDQLNTLSGLQTQAAERDRQDLVRTAAAAARFDADVLSEVVQLKELRLEMREVEENGAKSQVPFVVSGEGETASAEALGSYAEKHLAKFLPALKADAAPAAKPPVRFPEQQPSGKAHNPSAKELAAAVGGGVLPSQRK